MVLLSEAPGDEGPGERERLGELRHHPEGDPPSLVAHVERRQTNHPAEPFLICNSQNGGQNKMVASIY